MQPIITTTMLRRQNKAPLTKATFRFSTFVLLAVCLFACEREEGPLPAAIAALISSQTDCTCEPYVDQFQWKGNTVYISSCRGPACKCLISYYNKSGEAFQPEPGYSFDQFRRESPLCKTGLALRRIESFLTLK